MTKQRPRAFAGLLGQAGQGDSESGHAEWGVRERVGPRAAWTCGRAWSGRRWLSAGTGKACRVAAHAFVCRRERLADFAARAGPTAGNQAEREGVLRFFSRPTEARLREGSSTVGAAPVRRIASPP